MKRIYGRSLLTLLLAAIMLFVMAVPAFAAQEGTPSPLLWAAYPITVYDDQTNQNCVTFSTDDLSSGPVYSWTKYSAEGIVFGTCNVDGKGDPIPDTFQPIPASELTASEGLTLDTKLPVRVQGDPYDKYYVTPRPDADGMDYTISWRGYSIAVTSKPWDLDFFREPRISLDTWRVGYYSPQVYFNPVHSTSYYVGSLLTDEADGRHLSDLKLYPEWDTRVKLQRVRDGVYQLDISEGFGPDCDQFPICLDATWTEVDGTVRSEYWPFIFLAGRLIVASEMPLFDDSNPLGTDMLYNNAADKLTTTLTMTAGEEKEVYLYTMNQNEVQDWWIVKQAASFYHTDDEKLTLTPAGKDSAKFTLHCDRAGSYEIYVGFKQMDYNNMRLYHADGTLYTQEEWKEFDDKVLCVLNPDGTMEVQPYNGEGHDETDYSKNVSFEEMFPGQRYELDTLGMEDRHYWRLTVNVENPTKDFADVPGNAWYRDELNYCVRKGLLQGTGESAFSPDGAAQRSAVVTVLHRMKGEPSAVGNAFSDVPAGKWYTSAVDWAAESGMVGGYEDNTFRPAKDITRQELMVMLWRYARAEGYDVSAGDGLSAYTDAGQVADWALPAVKWAVSCGMLHTEGGRLDPGAVARRCDLAYALANFLQNG